MATDEVVARSMSARAFGHWAWLVAVGGQWPFAVANASGRRLIEPATTSRPTVRGGRRGSRALDERASIWALGMALPRSGGHRVSCSQRFRSQAHRASDYFAPNHAWRQTNVVARSMSARAFGHWAWPRLGWESMAFGCGQRFRSQAHRASDHFAPNHAWRQTNVVARSMSARAFRARCCRERILLPATSAVGRQRWQRIVQRHVCIADSRSVLVC
jgi:hypothetical protein